MSSSTVSVESAVFFSIINWSFLFLNFYILFSSETRELCQSLLILVDSHFHIGLEPHTDHLEHGAF